MTGCPHTIMLSTLRFVTVRIKSGKVLLGLVEYYLALMIATTA